MKIALIHPLKHHAYHALEGLVKHNNNSEAFFGYYNKNDWIDKLLAKTPYKSLINGYQQESINLNVRTNAIVKILFLLSKKWPKKFNTLYFYIYQKWCIRHLKEFDAIYVLQDYCNDVIRNAKNQGAKIMYDQILAFNFERYINEVTAFSPNEKLKQQIYNLYASDVIIAPSTFVHDSLMNYEFSDVIKDKIVDYHYGGDVTKYVFKKRIRKSEETLRLLFVGSITYRKGINYLIDAMKNLKEVNVILTIVGAANSHEGQEILDRTKGFNNISYVGTIPHEKMNELYEDHHVFILPSLAEGSSLSVFEALACGLPCIVTENTGSTVEDGVEGFIIHAKSSEEIKSKILTLYQNLELLGEMSIAARKNAEFYTWERFSNEVAELCFNLESI